MMNTIISYQLKNSEYKIVSDFFGPYIQENKNQYILNRYVYDGVLLTIYNSLKIVIQGKDLTKIVALFKQKFNIQIDLNTIDISNQQQIQFPIIGCDEVGVGDFFGGLVTACVYIDQNDFWKAKTLNIADSKQLDDQKILELYPILIKEFKYATASFSPSEYNKFYEQFPNNHLIKTYLHNKALTRLTSKLNNSCEIVMDAYVSKQKYNDYLSQLNVQKPIKIDKFVQKAESKYLAVAMASMIARATFLIQINKINEKLKLTLPLGVNYDKIYQTSFSILDKYGIECFDKLIKKHFKTYNLVLEQYYQNKK